ncbi:TadE/TadG family type IV pilus assembly protein [Hirschia maritima]|uniref:TadE/TadG family type IV pilus assembly protein n=1 Tax=Hirschia maritima TaxID=1121961 RepID=UPI00036FBEFA|nr:TadE/TadG family type IV pilus assembly protein [Hirschia maritima]
MLKKFLKDDSGIASVEFAFLAPVFFMFIFAFFETGWVMTKAVMLENSVANVSRLIYTGKAPTKLALEEQICEANPLITNCVSNINVEMQVIQNMGDTPDTDMQCRDEADEAFNPAVNYNSGQGAEIIFLRVCLKTDILVPGLGFGLALDEDGDGRYEIRSSTAFMNEPF